MFRRVNFKQRLLYIFIVLSIFVFFVLIWLLSHNDLNSSNSKNNGLDNLIVKTLLSDKTLPQASVQNCRMPFNECFNIYRCAYNRENRINVYVYPFTKYLDAYGVQISPDISREFYDLVKALKESVYYTSNVEKACLIVPPIDMLNQRRLDVKNAGRILSNLPSWMEVGGLNHLIFNMIPGNAPDFNTSLDVPIERAILAGGGFSSLRYRLEFDVSIPVFNTLTRLSQNENDSQEDYSMKIFLLATQLNYNRKYRSILEDLHEEHDDVLVLKECLIHNDKIYSRCNGLTIYKYPLIMKYATFCMVIRGARLGQSALLDALMMGCIPVVAADDYVMPFFEVLDWSRAAVIIREDEIQSVVKILKTYTQQEIIDMKNQVDYFWNNYLSSMKQIALTTIKIINGRVFKNSALSYEEWNTPNIPSQISSFVKPPLLSLPLMSSKEKGFTAVVLTYDRVPLLFRVLKQIDRSQSLVKIVVVWNNVNKRPPPVSEWPILTKPVKIIETKANKLSNRFFPYNEIETEAVFSLDDDIFMLTVDEIEFAFEIWSEHPDRLIGFPGRLHTLTSGKLKYESEWLDDVSLVLTGAAFYHKFYNHLFTYKMPSKVREWVDEHINCEDIAMNFLVANYTHKAPIKVTPRKRFKCPECVNDDALGVNQTHFIERSKCIEEFVQFFGSLPLESVEFRVDPILHLSNVSRSLKRFKNVGTI